MASTGPAVSCLMVTRDRPALAARAIRCFAVQRYPVRELVIVCQGPSGYRRHLADVARRCEVSDVTILAADDDLLLGVLRNRALDAASGDLVCVWDDDDCSHPDRLDAQVRHLLDERSHSGFLADHLQLFADERTLYWIDWDLGTPAARYPLLPPTMIMTHDRRYRYPESGPRAHYGEDWALLTELHDHEAVSYLHDHGHLYVYTYHGTNTFSGSHHAKLRTRARGAGAVREKENDVRSAVEHVGLSGPLLVRGGDGPAFSIEGRAR